MTARKLPSLNALRAFEASARHRSFTLAAQEMSVTQGAVSHQVKALEDELGLKLFERLHNQLRLSDAGQRYLEVIRDAFERIESGTQSLQQRSGREGLVISASPNFASKWPGAQTRTFLGAIPGTGSAAERGATSRQLRR